MTDWMTHTESVSDTARVCVNHAGLVWKLRIGTTRRRLKQSIAVSDTGRLRHGYVRVLSKCVISHNYMSSHNCGANCIGATVTHTSTPRGVQRTRNFQTSERDPLLTYAGDMPCARGFTRLVAPCSISCPHLHLAKFSSCASRQICTPAHIWYSLKTGLIQGR